MTKKTTTKAGVPFTGRAVTVKRVSPLAGEAMELEIVDGIVVSQKKLTRAPDMPASCIAKGIDAMWNQYRDSDWEAKDE